MYPQSANQERWAGNVDGNGRGPRESANESDYATLRGRAYGIERFLLAGCHANGHANESDDARYHCIVPLHESDHAMTSHESGHAESHESGHVETHENDCRALQTNHHASVLHANVSVRDDGALPSQTCRRG